MHPWIFIRDFWKDRRLWWYAAESERLMQESAHRSWQMCIRYKAVINTGIAGSLQSEINIGDIVLSTDTLQHDMDAREFGYPIGQVPRMDTLAFPADEELRSLAAEVCRQVNPDIRVFEGRVVSGDQFIAKKEVKDQIIENTGGYCTEMEGAAIGQAAYLNQIPYLVIRAISDKADDSAHMDYPAFEREAIRHTVNLVEGMAARL